MPGRQARKRIHFVRATYNVGAEPALSLETMVRRALRNRSVTASQVPIPALGIMETRQKVVPNRGFIRMALGAGAPGESMSTMGLTVAGEGDTDYANAPPHNRAFKLSDAFVLVEGNELLVMVDGMRLGSVALYLRLLLGVAGQPAAHSAFELAPVGDPDKEAVLAEEGVSALKLSGSAYAAENPDALAPGADATGLVEQLWANLTGKIRDVFEYEAGNDQERARLAASWGDLKVTTTIRARGGSRADPIVLQNLQGIGIDLIEDAPVGMDLQIVTGQGSKVSPSELVLGKYVTVDRQDRRNDLSIPDMWSELEDYRIELGQQGRWNP